MSGNLTGLSEFPAGDFPRETNGRQRKRTQHIKQKLMTGKTYHRDTLKAKSGQDQQHFPIYGIIKQKNSMKTLKFEAENRKKIPM